MNDSKDETINMLLDVDNFYGEHEGRLGPILIFLAIAAAPPLLWVYLGYPVPAWLFGPVYVVFVVRAAMITIGREKDRLDHFRKQLNDEYSSIYSMLGVSTVHENGCIEYLNGRVGFILVAYNGTVQDNAARSRMLKDFISLFGADFDIDVYVQNINETKALESRYKGVKLFVEPEAAKDFIDIIDYNRKIVYSSSLMTRTVFLVKGRKSAWKEIRDNLETAVHSMSARAYKSVMVADKKLVDDIFSRDVGTLINIEEMLRKKYATHNYYGSKVLYYDQPEQVVTPKEKQTSTGFMQRL